MQLDETVIRNVVRQVLSEIAPSAGRPAKSPTTTASYHGTTPVGSIRNYSRRHGVFTCPDEAVAAATAAFDEISARPIEDRKAAIACIRRIATEQSAELGRMELEETRIGRLEHKIEKLHILGAQTPGVEFLQSQVYSGDRGLAVVEHAPFGVIGAITPVTHSLPTITGNAIAMIAAGNSLVVNPHPSGKRVATEGVRRFNEAIHRAIGVDNLICAIEEPTIESANALFKHRGIAVICVTGGPGVARAALNSGKRAIVAGPGNPPVVVDASADLDNAAKAIIRGAAYDNNLLCISEKEVFCLDAVFDDMMAAMQRHGAVRLYEKEIDTLTAKAFVREGDKSRLLASKELLGQDAAVLAKAAGRTVPNGTELLFGEVPESNPFVPVEQMMPFLPFVRVRDIDEAVEKAKHYEHGYRHTAVIHTNNVSNMTKMGRALDTSLFVKNGPSLASLAIGGEGYVSFSIATPTGEGVTTPLTFTRQRRCTLVDDLHILGK